MHEHKCDLPTAVQWISDLNDRLVEEVLATLKKLPSFGCLVFDQQASKYIEGLCNCVRAHDSWCFEVSHSSSLIWCMLRLTNDQSERYFGREGSEIRKHRVVYLLPKKTDDVIRSEHAVKEF